MAKLIFWICFTVLLTACMGGHKQDVKKVTSADSVAGVVTQPFTQFTHQQLEAFFDSTGNLLPQPLINKVAFVADSLFRDLGQSHNRQVSPSDFAALKKAAFSGMIAKTLARRIFGELTVDSACEVLPPADKVKVGSVYLEYFPFDADKRKFDEFAICVGDRQHCKGAELYFFKGDRIIARQEIHTHYNPDIDHYKDSDGKTVVYYVKEFTDGSDVWWNNYFFYKYNGDKLLPVLNAMSGSNQQGMPLPRVFSFETEIVRTRPLTIKMAYMDNLPDLGANSYGPNIINDSTMVTYVSDEQSKSFRGKYDKSKISEAQILSYYQGDNDLLFVNTHYQIFKNALRDTAKSRWIFHYLNTIKNYGARKAQGKWPEHY